MEPLHSWRWWRATPARASLGVLIILIIVLLVGLFVTYVLAPMLAGTITIVALVVILRFALTGRIGWHSGGKK